MTPLRLDTPPVEPVSLAEMRRHLRLDPDDGGAEDDLVAGLITAARARVEAETRRLLAPGRYRMVIEAWPADGWLPLPLSPLVALESAGLVDSAGGLLPLTPGLVRLGPDPAERPGLAVSPEIPALAGRAVLVEVAAGHGGDGPPVPAPLAHAIRLLVAQAYEERGDGPGGGALPPMVAALIAPWRRLRL